MRVRTWSFLICFAAAAALVPASRAADEPASVAGKWEVTTHGVYGQLTQTMTIEQKGKDIHGTLAGERGAETFRGEVKGNSITFEVERQIPSRGKTLLRYTGTVTEGAMKGQVSPARGPGATFDWSAKRSEAKSK